MRRVSMSERYKSICYARGSVQDIAINYKMQMRRYSFRRSFLIDTVRQFLTHIFMFFFFFLKESNI